MRVIAAMSAEVAVRMLTSFIVQMAHSRKTKRPGTMIPGRFDCNPFALSGGRRRCAAASGTWGLIVFLLLGFVAGVLNVMRSAGVVASPGLDGGLRKD